jgi:hypothetical protein
MRESINSSVIRASFPNTGFSVDPELIKRRVLSAVGVLLLDFTVVVLGLRIAVLLKLTGRLS